MTEVVIMLHIIFWPVPDFMRDEPVTYSGPTTISIAMSAALLTGASGFEVMAAVRMPCSRQSLRTPMT